MSNLGESDPASRVVSSFTALANRPLDVAWLSDVAVDAALSPIMLSALVAALVAASMVLLELRRDTNWAGMRTGVGWTLSAMGFDAALAAVGAIATFKVVDLVAPVSWVGALVSGFCIGFAPLGVAALKLSPEGRNRLADARFFLAKEVMIATAREESTFVAARAATISKSMSLDDAVDRAVAFINARARHGGVENANEVEVLLQLLRTDAASLPHRFRALIQVLLDHNGRSLINDLKKECRKRDRKSRKGAAKAGEAKNGEPAIVNGPGDAMAKDPSKTSDSLGAPKFVRDGREDLATHSDQARGDDGGRPS